jgi:hypothetical protein
MYQAPTHPHFLFCPPTIPPNWNSENVGLPPGGGKENGYAEFDALRPTHIYIILNESWHDYYTPHGVNARHCAYCGKEHVWDPAQPSPPLLLALQCHIGSTETVRSILQYGVLLS